MTDNRVLAYDDSTGLWAIATDKAGNFKTDEKVDMINWPNVWKDELSVNYLKTYNNNKDKSWGKSFLFYKWFKAYSWIKAISLSSLLSGFVVGLSFYADRNLDYGAGMQSFILGVMALAVHLLVMIVMALLFGYGSSDMSPFPPIVCNEDIFCETRPPCAEKFADQYKWVITVNNCTLFPATQWELTATWVWVGKNRSMSSTNKNSPRHIDGARKTLEQNPRVTSGQALWF